MRIENEKRAEVQGREVFNEGSLGTRNKGQLATKLLLRKREY